MSENKINMIFGGFANNFETWQIILDLINEHPFMLLDDVQIRALFDNFGACTWNGGGYRFDKIFTENQVLNVVNYYKKRNIPIRLTMTNPVIEKRDLYDRYANMILSTCQDPINEVLVASPLVEEFIRAAYPKYKICRSIIAAKSVPYDLSDKYEMSVMKRSYNNNFEFLEQIPFEQREKLEFLCNESCVENCPRAYSHYEIHGIEQLNFCPGHHGALSNCNHPDRNEFRICELKNRYSYISPEAIRSDYIPRGFNNFKIAGRNQLFMVVEEFARYMIKPDYQQDFRCMFWSRYL